MKTQVPAVDGPVERRVRALDPERADFEAWWETERRRTWIEQGCDKDRGPEPTQAWGEAFRPYARRAWNAARPKRQAVGTIVNVAAALAQRKALAAFCEFEDARSIGCRQFARAYDKADEAMRLLAVKLADAARAL